MEDEVKNLVSDFFKDYPSQEFSKGDILLRPGDKVTKVSLLESGQVIVYDITPRGNEVVLNAFKPGAFFPLSNIINDPPNRYFIEAASPITLRQAPAQKILEFLQSQPAVTYDLLSRVYRGTDGMMRRMAHMMGASADARVVFEILNATWRFGIENSDRSVNLSLTESDLAKRCGLARETFSRSIKNLKDQQLLSINRGGMTIENLKDLENSLESGL